MVRLVKLVKISGYAVLSISIKVHTIDKHWYNVNFDSYFHLFHILHSSIPESLHGE